MAICEDDFLKSLVRKLSFDDTVVVPPGDDCAAITVTGDRLLLVTVDQVADSVHYHGQASDSPTQPELVGRKLLARNISDIAAMGGTPAFALLAVAVSREYDQQWLERFTNGVVTLSKDFGISLVGGDISSAKANVASITLIGYVQASLVCRRSQARVHDTIFVTGEFGGALKTNKHLSFVPRLQEANWLVEKGFTRAMIDVSDGLLKDLTRMCTASDLEARIGIEQIPRVSFQDQRCEVSEALLDGEDYELIFAVSSTRSSELLETWPFATRLTSIGRFVPSDSGISISDNEGNDMTQLYGAGYNHFG